MGLTTEETVVEFANVEPTAPTDSEDRTSLLPEVKALPWCPEAITAKSTSNSVRIKENSTGDSTFITTICKRVFFTHEIPSFN